MFTGMAFSNVYAQSPQSVVLTFYENLQREQAVDFKGFSSERGQNLFVSAFSDGKPDIPSCTTCHTPSPTGTGKTRAGKIIEPMALSINNARYTDTVKTEKWFRRNCKSVMGRECTPREKGDFLTFMMGQ
ncbi:MAG: DUF1924 domain-containing protein [Rhodospirillales bacterium]|nr:DUF1924 domain-containing protein [Rhodospirillales bacterium]